MGDFHQNGSVSTLHNLGQRPTEEIERELSLFKKSRPMGLVLPSLYSELEGPALSGIVSELSKVPYLEEIVIGLDNANLDQYKYSIEYFSKLHLIEFTLIPDTYKHEGMITNPSKSIINKQNYACGCFLFKKS